MNLSLRALILSAVLLFTATACRQDRVMAPDAGRADPIMLENYPQIVVLDELGDYVVFAAPNVRGGDQPMSVSVPIRLQSDREVNLQYRFEFFEIDGRRLGGPQDDSWRFIRLSRRGQHFLTGAALDTKATDWRLIVRPAR